MVLNRNKIISDCKKLLSAYQEGMLGKSDMPEDSHPEFLSGEDRLSYFTLPMALNYQRDSYKLWQAALKTYQDRKTRVVFDVSKAAHMEEDELRSHLLKYSLALQPQKHVTTWLTIAHTMYDNWKTFEKFIDTSQYDFLIIKNAVQIAYKKGFPYLSGPKIFNYWSFIISTYGGVALKHLEFIDIAPDTHVTKCSVKLGVISSSEAANLSKEEISNRWREVLHGSGILPINMHPPLWFWSRNNFVYKL